jgi:hypothetical protein
MVTVRFSNGFFLCYRRATIVEWHARGFTIRDSAGTLIAYIPNSSGIILDTIEPREVTVRPI